ncbi:hypothetical protein ACOSP7_009248 [Xanthoceras sorbifolium]
MESELSKILIFGGTGYLGKYLVKASVLLGHKTFGELEEHEKMVSVLRQVDVVISALAIPQFLDQLKIIDAIKVAGNIKVLIFSLSHKKKIRRAIEAADIPYTFVSANCFGAYFVNFLLRPQDQQHDHIVVYGRGQAKAVLNYEEDIATYTIKVANDPRTRNRVVIYRPETNIISQLELIYLWEQKIGRSFKRVHTPEEELVKLSETLPHPENIPVSILHSLFVKGDLMSFELGKEDIEASKLYPDSKFTTIHQLLDIFLIDPPKPATATFA